MDTVYVETQRQRTREALLEFGLSRDRTHWVTLNCHRVTTIETALQRLKRWRVEMLRRLHGRYFYRLPHGDRFEFFGSYELTKAGEPHFHLVCSVPLPRTERFERVAVDRWKAIVPSGTCHIVPVDALPDSPRRILGYALKFLDPNADLSFVDSRLFS